MKRNSMRTSGLTAAVGFGLALLGPTGCEIMKDHPIASGAAIGGAAGAATGAAIDGNNRWRGAAIGGAAGAAAGAGAGYVAKESMDD